MMTATAIDTRILLKARPTPEQLADRLAAPAPEGIELYLDRLDLVAVDWLEQVSGQVRRAGAPPDFVWIVEAPIRTLGGSFFDLTRDDDDHRETLRRVARVGSAIGAVAANVHVVAPTTDARELSADSRERKLAEALPLLEYYEMVCQEAGLVPQIENVPPVGRMRESAFVFSPIGAATDDLWALAEARPALRLTVDVSHAALSLNWRTVALSDVEPLLRPVAEFSRDRPGPTTLSEYVAAVADLTTTVHVSNASGLLGEGRSYDDGDENLDGSLRQLVGTVPYFVTETLETRPDRATGMREAQTRLLALRASCARGSA
ncbi:MAG TPA: hypothetical protein VNL16_17255 [Chloroflexota bacterium]|nr:hypothetical protein [Chloroflexota bacterium]